MSHIISKQNYIKTAFAAILIVALVSCASFVRNSYVTLSTAATVVEVARATYADFYAAGKVPQELDDKVAKVYANYQKGMHDAVDATRAYAAALVAFGPNASPDAANKAIDAAQLVIIDLFNLFTKAGVEAQAPTIQRK